MQSGADMIATAQQRASVEVTALRGALRNLTYLAAVGSVAGIVGVVLVPI